MSEHAQDSDQGSSPVVTKRGGFVRGWRGHWRTGPGWTGATIGIAVVVLVLWGWRAVGQRVAGAIGASVRVFATDLLLAAAVGIVVGLVLTVIARVIGRRIPVPFVAVLVAVAILIFSMGAGLSLPAWVVLVLVLCTAAGLVGALIGRLVAGRRPITRGRAVSTALSAVLALVLIGWLALPGSSVSGAPTSRTSASMPDPTAAGSYAVEQVTYGSGRAGLVPRYGPGVGVRTASVDATALISGWGPGTARASVLGFDASALPLNATVWRPRGATKAPLVLISHGNAQHPDSELGFEYLGRLLASRGYVVAALDTSFLNTGLLDRAGGITGGDKARAWILLQHLRQWRTWQQAGSGPASGADLAKVALIGHSRGGEAVAAAAELARAGRAPGYPGNLSTGAQIRSVIALAPSDGLIPTGTRAASPRTVSYLTLGGTQDADIGMFSGAEAYARVAPGPGQLRVAVSFQRGNHTQFNSRWGRHDGQVGVAARMIDIGALMAPEQQRRLTQAYVAGFLDLTLLGRPAARPLFTGGVPRTAALPETGYRISVGRGPLSHIETFERRRVSSGSVPTRLGPATVTGGTIAVQPIPTRIGLGSNAALLLRGSGPTLRVSAAGLPAGGDLVVDLADAAPPGSRSAPVVASLTATSRSGASARCALGALPGQLDGRVVKRPAVQTGRSSADIALQTFRVPRSCLSAAGVEPSQVASIALTFRGSADPGVYVDNLGVEAATGS